MGEERAINLNTWPSSNPCPCLSLKRGQMIKNALQYILVILFWAIGAGYLIDGSYFYAVTCAVFMVFAISREKFRSKRAEKIYWVVSFLMFVVLTFIVSDNDV